MTTELGLFVIWSEADHLRDRMLATICRRFEVRGVHRVAWSPERVLENFARFYRSKPTPPYGSLFVHQKGGRPFTLVAVVDEDPVYEERRTNRGVRLVNVRMLEAKLDLRGMSTLPKVVHGSETLEEANRDMYMLLGAAPEEYLGKHPGPWDGTVEELRRDVTGAGGWESLHAVFDALNHLVTYVVLRNFQGLPGSHLVGDHDDVDLLVEDYHEAVRVLNARPMGGILPRWGGRFHVRVAGEPVVFDLRFVGDGYFEREWQRQVLRRRRLSDSGIFVPSDPDHFETLAYHALVHKRELAPDYSRRLSEMALDEGVTGWSPEHLERREEARHLLHGLMRQRGRSFVRPRDPTVFFDYEMAGFALPWSRRKLAGLRREVGRRWRRVEAPVVERALQARYGVVRRFPALRRMRRRSVMG